MSNELKKYQTDLLSDLINKWTCNKSTHSRTWAHFWDTLQKTERVQTHTLLTDYHSCRMRRCVQSDKLWVCTMWCVPAGRRGRCKRVWGITGAELIFYLFYTLPLMRCHLLGPFILFISSFFIWFHFFYCCDSFYLLSFFLLPWVFYSLTSFYCSALRLQSLLFS